MVLFPFSKKGVEDKLTELYALSDPALALQADAIKSDVKLWILNAFDLTPLQKQYLANMNSRALDYYGDQCSICFLFRLPINLIYPNPPEAPGYAKWTGSSSDLQVKTDNKNEFVASGSLTFTITYH